MWVNLVRYILRYRLFNLVVIGLLTLFMGYQARKVSLSYEFVSMLPKDNPVNARYGEFKQVFGEDGAVMFLAVRDSAFYGFDKFRDWYRLTHSIRDLHGVEEVVSTARIFFLEKNDSLGKFEFKNLVDHEPGSQEEVDRLAAKINTLRFYDGLLFNRETHTTLMAITLKKDLLNTRERVGLVYRIKSLADDFGRKHGLQVHYSGLPYIRTITSKKLEDELKLFLLLAFLVASAFLFLFFRSKRAVVFTGLVVVVIVIWIFGVISLLGYEITMLTAVLPPLLVVIVVENCIFILNKYYYEFRMHGNKVKSLSRVIHRIGKANLITNAATAAGFASFTITGNKMLIEFGVVASIIIFSAYVVTLVMVTTLFSYFPPPGQRHIKHLERSVVKTVITKVTHVVENHRPRVFIVSAVIVLVGMAGAMRLKTTGNIVDDIPHRDPLYQDLLFLEKNFKGVMPLEISIDTKKKKGVMRLDNIRRIDSLQKVLATFPELSKPLSVAEVVKFAKQAFYNGNDSMYSLPNNQEKNFILTYVPEVKTEKRTVFNNFVDQDMRVTRISVQMANIGTHDIERINRELRPRIDSIFPPDKYDVQVTGSSVVFLEGTNYLVRNLMESFLLALLIIAVLMALLFGSPKMILISILPNLVPQLMTAGLMGYLGISIKPSTILIFSIALGISVDNAIQYLSRYRLQLKLTDGNVRESVLHSLSETGFSIIYSSIVLFFGFIIFTLSTFGGTVALGYLIAFTMLVALLCNLYILPSVLIALEGWIRKGSQAKALIEVEEIEEMEGNKPDYHHETP
jgi:predicted RND superfamily exporter protein